MINKKVTLASIAVTSALLVACQSGPELSANNTVGSQVFFDDFSYQNRDEFYQQGWKSRDLTGHPGIAGATWSDEGVSFLANKSGAENGVMRLSSVTGGKGENTRHTQVCHARKYLKGTYAARVFFRDEPTTGPDGDEVIQTFYAISPLKAPMDLDYSETDFEYLPNGGWGANEKPAMWSTTWETFQLKPWTKVNEYTRKEGSHAGWRTLVLQVQEDKVSYYVDGELLSHHSEKVSPEVPMSINFNLWFMPKGADGSRGPIQSELLREYQQDVDWVFHIADEIVAPNDVPAKIEQLRAQQIARLDTVPERNPALPSPCGL